MFDRNRFYLNTARPAPCNGTITSLRYCYYGREDSNRNTYQVLVALYRPEPGSNNYQNITNTISITKQTPISQVPLADALLPGFNCDSVELEESVQVLAEDVIGVCHTNDNNLNRLDVVSRTNNGYNMFYIDTDQLNDINNCESGVLPDVVGDNLQETGILRILHIFAEICELSYPLKCYCIMHMCVTEI